MSNLEGRVALVTGGSRGIGAAIARSLAKQGAKVAITYNSSREKAEQLVKEIESRGGEALAIQGNSAQNGAQKQLIDSVINKWNQGIDILVNNAGVFALGNLADTGLEVYEQNFDLNVKGVYETTRAAIPHLNEKGRVINIGSAVADYAFPGASAYVATKAAVGGLARSWAKELAPKQITVNTVNPGSINTDMNPDIPENEMAGFQKTLNPLGRYGTPNEIAAAVTFLAGPDASFITGATLNVDGGMTA